jgi:hypothetical protein
MKQRNMLQQFLLELRMLQLVKVTNYNLLCTRVVKFVFERDDNVFNMCHCFLETCTRLIYKTIIA